MLRGNGDGEHASRMDQWTTNARMVSLIMGACVDETIQATLAQKRLCPTHVFASALHADCANDERISFSVHRARGCHHAAPQHSFHKNLTLGVLLLKSLSGE